MPTAKPPVGHGHQGCHEEVPESDEPLCGGRGCAGAQCGRPGPASQSPPPQHRVGAARPRESGFGDRQDHDVRPGALCRGPSREEDGAVFRQCSAGDGRLGQWSGEKGKRQNLQRCFLPEAHTHKRGVGERAAGVHAPPGERRKDGAHTGSRHHREGHRPRQPPGGPDGQHDSVQRKEGGLDGTTSELSIKGDHVADGASHGGPRSSRRAEQPLENSVRRPSGTAGKKLQLLFHSDVFAKLLHLQGDSQKGFLDKHRFLVTFRSYC
ncbi:PRELI domain containing protein 3A isoform X2 [Camelus dromedarius]|uniref:PRELI domain containing protein 3A isoform X2 n=1 Tax=Camelus dromedarius TaxID=9838 RepID=UPI003119A355